MKPFGTTRRKAVDVSRMAEAFGRPGIDPRMWVSHGTVSVGPLNESGDLDVTDPQAVHIGPSGVSVDVVLEPSNVPVTCKYSGIQGGRSCAIYAPIKAGDLVLVVLPQGDLSGTPVIVAILNSAYEKMPLDAEDRKPFFRNDRLSIFTEDVPIDLRTRGGARVLLQQTGSASIEVPAGQTVQVGGTGLTALQDGVVTAQGVDPFTGLTYGALGNASQTVLARKL